MAEPIILQKLVDADVDADTLGEFANEDKTVVSRLGLEYPSAPMASRLVVENGLLGATPFSAYTALTASALVEGDYAIVTNDDTPSKNGIYQKIGGVWTYIKYNLYNDIFQLKKQALANAKYDLYNSYYDGEGAEKNSDGYLNNTNIYINYTHATKSLTTIWQHSKTMMLKTVWRPNGHNSLFNFRSVSYANGSDPNTATWNLIQEVDTDYIPPVSFTATTGAVSESGTGTTGGNHGTSGGTGDITAHMTSCGVFLNGSLITSDFEGFADSVQCRWTNKLYAGNTVNEQRYTLIQDVIADFSRGHVGVTLKTTALEPIDIVYEGGTQLVGQGWDEAASFYGGVNKGFSKASTMEAGTKTTAPDAWAVVLKSPIYGYMAAYIDRGFGVKLSKIGSTDLMANKNIVSWKFYNYTMRGYPAAQKMVADESHVWRGGYAYAPINITDLESAFIAKIGSRTAIGYEALSGQKGDIRLPTNLAINEYFGLQSAPDGVYVNAPSYQTSLAKEL